jgi:putative ABC transport system permease protein
MSLSFTTIAGKLVQIWSWDTTTAADTVEFAPSSGARGIALWSALAAGKLAVSKAFAYQHRLHVGDQLTVPALTGTYTSTVVSIIPDYLTDNGTIYTSLGVFHRMTGDDRLHHVSIRLSPGASPAAVAAAIKAELPQYPDMIVFTAVGLRTELMAIVTRVLTVLRALALAALLLAILVGAATTTASLAARRAPLALSRVIGATSAVLRRQLATECVLVGVAGWLVALPAGLLGIGAAVHAVGARSGMLPPVDYPTVQILALLPLSVAAATVAMWLPTRSLLKTSILEAVRYE